MPTLNTSAETGRLFNVLSVEVFNLRCISTAVVETQPSLNKRTSIQNTVQTNVSPEFRAASLQACDMTDRAKKRRARVLWAEQKRMRRIHGLAFSLLDDNNCGDVSQAWKAAEARHAASTRYQPRPLAG